MRFLVDECVGRRVARWLDEQGHDVVFMRDLHKGAPVADDLLATKIRILSHLLTEQAHELADSFVVAGSDRVRIRTTKR